MAKSALTPEQAMYWVLFDHDHPDIRVHYSKEEQAKKIVAILEDNGYVIVEGSRNGYEICSICDLVVKEFVRRGHTRVICMDCLGETDD